MDTTPTSPSVSTADDVELDTLSAQIEHLCQTAGFLSHRVDSMQRALDQESFQLENHPITVQPTAKAKHVEELLQALNLPQESLTLGKFLRALNLYLIHEDLVNLNDLQIHLNPLLSAAFQKPKSLKKIPYGLLLLSLPRMFQ
jgi:hypothetical protein